MILLTYTYHSGRKSKNRLIFIRNVQTVFIFPPPGVVNVNVRGLALPTARPIAGINVNGLDLLLYIYDDIAYPDARR